MSDHLGVGLIGCGEQGRVNLASGVARIKSARLVACADPDEGTTRRVADEFQVEKVYKSTAELVGSSDVDAVIVAVPHLHLKAETLVAIEAGKHVFIEKPMGMSAAEGGEIVEAAEKQGVVAMVGYCMRYSLSRMAIKSLLDRGAVGDIKFVVAGKGGGPLQGWLGGPYAQGGGQLLFLGSHLTDQVLWMTGDNAEAVSGHVRWNAGGTDETSAYTVRLKGGALASFTVSQAAGANFDFIDIFGSKGRLRGDWHGDIVTVQSQVIPEYEHQTVFTVPGDNLGEMCYREMVAFVEAAISGHSSPVPTSDGLRVLEILDAVVASSESGKWESIAN